MPQAGQGPAIALSRPPLVDRPTDRRSPLSRRPGRPPARKVLSPEARRPWPPARSRFEGGRASQLLPGACLGPEAINAPAPSRKTETSRGSRRRRRCPVDPRAVRPTGQQKERRVLSGPAQPNRADDQKILLRRCLRAMEWRTRLLKQMLRIAAMDAKMMVATGSGDVQQLKHLVRKQEQDSNIMVVVMAKQATSVEKPCPRQRNMDPHLLALASSGSFEELQTLLNREDGQASGHVTDGSLTTRRASSYGGDTEANESILEVKGITAEGDTALHVVAACGQGDNFFNRSREAKHLLLVEQNNIKRCPTRAEHQALTTYGDGDSFLESARIIYGKAKHLLSVQNNKGDTPLHCAAWAGKSNMVACLIDLASAEGEDRIKELLRKQNKHKETTLHEAVRVGNSYIMEEDSELASFPEDDGTSPMYLAIMQNRDEIVKTLYDKSSDGKLSFSGPNRQNALHAAVLRSRSRDFMKLLKWNETHLCLQNMDLTTQRDENGSTPLHFAAAIKFLFRPSSICQQVLEANPNALYQPDHAGFFPIHVAASVGAFWNVRMFVTKFPGSAGLRDAKGRREGHFCMLLLRRRRQT